MLWELNFIILKLMMFYFAILSVNSHFYFRFTKIMYVENLVVWYFGILITSLVFNLVINSAIFGGITAIADNKYKGFALIIIGMLSLGLESKFCF